MGPIEPEFRQDGKEVDRAGVIGEGQERGGISVPKLNKTKTGAKSLIY